MYCVQEKYGMTEFVVKCDYNGSVRIIGTIKPNCTLKKLKKKLRGEFKRDLELKYKDADGDLIMLKKPAHLKDALKDLASKKECVLKLNLTDLPNSLR